jgi:hypothetical protein
MASQGLVKASKLIVQYESLCKLDECKPFDLILLDEVCSVLDQGAQNKPMAVT